MQGRLSFSTTDSPSGSVAKVCPRKRSNVLFSGRNWVRQHRDDATWIEKNHMHKLALRELFYPKFKSVRLKSIE